MKYLTQKFPLHYRKIIREYFDFNRSQRRAIFFLLVISVLSILLPSVFQKLKKEEKTSDEKLTAVRKLLAQNNPDSGFQSLHQSEIFYFNPNTASKEDWVSLGIKENIADRIINYITKGGEFYQKTDVLKIYGFQESDYQRLEPFIVFDDEEISEFNQKNYTTGEQIQLFPFNPNNISKEQWIQFGVKDFIAERILNYVAKGGKFYSSEDVMKIYGFSQQDYDRLENYFVFDANENFQTNEEQTISSVPAEKQITEINAATKEQLIALGFSNYNANGIITYREQLGGYYSLNQLHDVYKIDLIALSSALPFLKIDNSAIVKLNINSATFEQLEKHAYLSEKTAQAIIDYRTSKGNFIILTELQSVKGMYPELFEKLKPYLTL